MQKAHTSIYNSSTHILTKTHLHLQSLLFLQISLPTRRPLLSVSLSLFPSPFAFFFPLLLFFSFHSSSPCLFNGQLQNQDQFISQSGVKGKIFYISFSGTSANAGPHYQKLYARVTHIWGNRKGQPSPSAMKGPRLERTASLITVPPASGKYAFQAYACRGKTLPHLCPCGTALHASNQPLSVPALARHVFFRLPFGAAGLLCTEENAIVIVFPFIKCVFPKREVGHTRR